MEDTWNFLQAQTMERNRVECKRWLLTTEEGQIRLTLDIKKLMKAWEDCWEGVVSPKLSEWDAVYDPTYGTVFWCNSRTLERLGAGDKFSKEDARRIAVEQFIAARTEEEMNRFFDVRNREAVRAKSEHAARVIQNLFKSHPQII